MILLGLAGEMGSGKSTAAKFLIDTYKEKKAKEYEFASFLKYVSKEVFHLSDFQIRTQEGKRNAFANKIILDDLHLGAIDYLIKRELDNLNLKLKGVSILNPDKNKKKALELIGATFTNPREVLQFVGTEIMRNCYDADIHAEITFANIKRENSGFAIISDARFVNEREQIKKMGGYNILISNPIQTSYSDPVLIKKHASELECKKDYTIDFEIVNFKKSFSEFEDKILTCVVDIIRRKNLFPT